MPPPKSHRVHSTSNIRSHSRSSSSTKLSGNVQTIQKDFVQPKGLEKTKKISHEHTRTTSLLPRTNSAVRVEAREREHQIAPPSKRQPPSTTASTNKANGSKLKGGFTISIDSENDDDAWVSSEADTSTESVNLARESDPDSDTENASTPIARESSMLRLTKRTLSTQNATAKRSGSETGLSRINTARPADANGSSKGVAQRNSAPRLERMGSQRRVSQIFKAPPTPVTSPPPPSAELNHHDSRPVGPSTQPQSQLLTPPEPAPKINGNILAKMQPPPTFSPGQSSHHPESPYQTDALSNSSYQFASPDETARQNQALRHVTAPGNDTEARPMPHHFQKINGSPILHRGPPPGYLQQRSDRQPRYLDDCRLMDPPAAARFAEAIAAQDQDPAELAALLSKPSSPNVTESRLYPRPGKSPGDASKSTAVRAVSGQVQGQTDNSSGNRRHSSAIVPSESASGSTSPRSKHHSRPSSVYSVSSKHLRPHPLIRGQTHGPSGIQSKPAPLAPLTVIPDSTSQLSSSVPNVSSLNNLTDRHAPTSPVSSLTAPPSPNAPLATQSPFRRSSVSSARSVSTLPVTTSVKEARMKPDRHRTLSTISSSSSIAALSSLVHLPVTTSHRISLFPPIDEDVGKIHPLLPPPYAENHLQFLAHRSPLRTSYDRVMRAKTAATAGR
ncbi:hypothetical protein DFS33DRAFT_91976 [Desarmillaria ectypa]|nr:hypothetical protein DFS33DRAFT_91976 [Desarmillaria ectypa]